MVDDEAPKKKSGRPRKVEDKPTEAQINITSEEEALELLEEKYQHIKGTRDELTIVISDGNVFYGSDWELADKYSKEKGKKFFEVTF